MKRIEPSREWSCTIETIEDSRSLASLPGTSRSNESSMAPLDVGQTTGLTMAPVVRSGASFRPTFVKETCVEASREPSTECVRGWLAVSRVVRRYFKSIFFFYTLPFFSFFPSLGNSRLLLARLCERQRQNSSLMGRLWLEDIRVLFFRTSPWESRASLPG